MEVVIKVKVGLWNDFCGGLKSNNSYEIIKFFENGVFI